MSIGPVRRALLLAVAAAAVAGTAPLASAAFGPCGRTAGITCEEVTVPVDREHPSSGALQLHVERVRAAAEPAEGAIVALAGGPGQSATAHLASFLKILQSARETRDVIVFDQRGTGESGYLACPPQRPLDYGCAEALEPGIHHYTTQDSADDVEAVRRTLGVDRIALYGVSYGTKVALAYAKRYPTHVERLALDSVVGLDGFDFFERGSYAAVPRVLGDLCADGACDAFTSNLEADVAAAVNSAEARQLVVSAVDPSGAPVSKRPTSHDLFDLLVAGTSYDPVIRARFPSAVRSALNGDGYPLGRLLAAVAPAGHGGAGSRGFDDVVFRATLCEELAPTPWRHLSVGARLPWASAFLDGLPATDFLPFTAGTALDGELVRACRAWPVLPTPPTISGPGLPDVPTLLLDGEEDLLTPVEDAAAARTAFPRGVLVRVPDMGHAVEASAAGSNGGACAKRALERFFADESVAQCPDTKPRTAARKMPPTSLDALQPVFQPALPGRLLRAVFAALADVRDTNRSLLLPKVGLRGGTFAKRGGALKLAHVVYVPDVEVSGTYRIGKPSDVLHVDGSSGSGWLKIGAHKVRGKIAGRSFVVPKPSGL
jgi:pimeloyl-ACP methyl ester carboxylesterase